ncbi:MAG: hypothetical protein J6O39_01210 [Treponema sp.]|nr:hypothetical protein [Treponema sp.]
MGLHGSSEKKSADGSAENLTFTGGKNGSVNLDQVEVFEGADDTATE